jgi:hypothetical protein
VQFVVIDLDKTRPGEQQQLVRKYYKGYIPHVVVLDGKGTAVYDEAGEVNESTIEGILDKLLKPPSAVVSNAGGHPLPYGQGAYRQIFEQQISPEEGGTVTMSKATSTIDGSTFEPESSEVFSRATVPVRRTSYIRPTKSTLTVFGSLIGRYDGSGRSLAAWVPSVVVHVPRTHSAPRQ